MFARKMTEWSEVREMTEENKPDVAQEQVAEEASVFDEAEVSTELPTEAPNLEADPAEEEKEWVPTVSKESPKDKKERLGEKKPMDGKVLTIKSVFFTKPKTQGFDGAKIEPKKTQDGTKEYYPGKLGIRFEEDNLVEYYPNFHYFLNDEGQVSTFAKINRSGNNAVSKIFKLVVEKLGKPEDDVADQEVYDYLVGKKVTIKVDSGIYLGKKWFRNDITKIEG